MVVDCGIRYAPNTPAGDAYLTTLFTAFECPTAPQDFALFLIRTWEANPTWDPKFNPRTTGLEKIAETAVHSQAAETLQDYGDNYAIHDLGKTGIPVDCLWNLHISRGNLSTLQDKTKFQGEIEDILSRGASAHERVKDKIRHKPWPVEKAEVYSEEKRKEKSICGCHSKSQKRGYRFLTYNGLCASLRAWYSSANHLHGCTFLK